MIRITLELPISKDEAKGAENHLDGDPNSLACAAVQILRLPENQKVIPGAKVGDPVSGRIVFQWVGPLKIRVSDDSSKDSPRSHTKRDVSRKPKRNRRTGVEPRRRNKSRD
jgi:hypothetical protein